MSLRILEDHGEIIHYAGRHHLFPVARRDDPRRVRLAGKEDGNNPDETRVGWGEYFEPFNRDGLVFLAGDGKGAAVTRAEAEAAIAAVPAEKLTP